ncbi:MAG TPA: hypothetical protein VMC84_04870 [Methanocella sp.]|uniref:hypothetical protein n=1 Tax=Methanocella sp. TaxID=2052833 RepID=UPI002CCA5008|nr:hypothetical protein [Methanocella sp.]HTY90489.1 hypothetical protein [Methanocella sp.]
MDRKVLAMFLILLTAACLIAGCTGRRNEATSTPTTAPAAVTTVTPAAGATVQPSAAPGQASATPAPSTAITENSSPGVAGLDPSLLSISGENQDEGGFSDDGLPTPTVD